MITNTFRTKSAQNRHASDNSGNSGRSNRPKSKPRSDRSRASQPRSGGSRKDQQRDHRGRRQHPRAKGRGPARRPQSRFDRFRRKKGKPAGPRYRVVSENARERAKIAPVAPGKLRIFSLGGLEDVGERNMQVFEYGDDIITIDCGLWFADPDTMPGIDYVVPNATYLQQNAKRIRGMLMCHGHLDHIGGLAHVAPLIGFPPVYSTPLTKAFLEKRQEEYGNLGRFKMNTFKPRDVFTLGSFKIEVFHINHNVPEAVGFAIHTPVGTVVHSGDFKFDLSPTSGQPADMAHLAQIGERGGVLAMLSDSTSAGRPGHQISEQIVLQNLEDLIKNLKGRIIAVTFSSLLMRVQMLVQLAEKYGRKIIIEGRSMQQNIDIAHALKLLKIDRGTVIDIRQINDFPDDKIMIIGTGAQAEEFAMLNRVANQEHPRIKIKRGDTVLFSSSVIPGHERNVDALKDTLHRQGAEIIHYSMMDVHAGGHAKNEDIKLMMRLIKPRYLMPIHANFTKRLETARLGAITGIPLQNSLLIENGDIVEFDKNGSAEFGKVKVPSGNIMVDGLGEGDVSQIVLRDRRDLAAEGIIIAIVTTNDHGQLVGEPNIISRGFMTDKEVKVLNPEMQKRVKDVLAGAANQTEANSDFIKTKIRNDLGQFAWNKTERRPMVLPIIVRA